MLSNSCLVLPAVVKQQQEEISRNHVPSLFAVSVKALLAWTEGRELCHATRPTRPFESTQMTPLDVQSDVDVLAHVGPMAAALPFHLHCCLHLRIHLFQFDTTKGDSFGGGVMGGGAVGTGTERRD